MKPFHCFLLLTTLSLASLSTIAFTADIKPDYFFISLKWPKTQCKSKEGCCLPKKGSPSLNDFVIHEFQAFYSSNGGTIANCTTGTKFQPSKIADLVPSLQKYWPSLSCPSRDSKKLWKEEWVEYGTCAETLFNQHDYFAAALRVYKQINLLKVLADAGIKPNGTYYPGEAINKAIAKAGLGEITVSCREDEKGVNAVLDYITFCASNKGTMRSFPVSVRPPAPAKKISLGSRRAEPAKPTDPHTEASLPSGLPLTTTHPASSSGDQDAARAVKRGKEKESEIEEVVTAKRPRRDGSGSTTPVIDVLMKHGDEPPSALLSRICAAAPPPEKTSGWSTALVGERIARDLIQMAHSVTDLFARAKDGDEIHRREVAPLKKALAKREQRIKELEGKLKTAEETGRRILERADLGEKILTDPVLLARHICREQETGEAVLAAISRTLIGEDLMYEFGTWAFNSGRRAMQNDVKAALEVSIDDIDLPRILAVLPEEVPDLGPTPFSTVPDGRALPVPVVEVSVGPSAEAAATAGPTSEPEAVPSAGPSAEGDAVPGVEPPAEAN